MSEKTKLNLHFYTWEEIKKIFFVKKFENVILFSQPRSGSTFVSNLLSQELNYSENFYPEEFFINQHFVYLKSFVKKHSKFFININEYWYRRTDLKKNNTMYLYLYRDSTEILNSYEKAKKLNYYLGWEEMIHKYRRFFPDIGNIVSAPLFGHKVWEQQIKKFDNAYTISYDSFKTHKFYLNSKIRDEKITKLKSIELVENTNIKKKFTEEMKGNVSLVQRKKINFNTWEKIYFFIRRKLESKKVNRKNY
tara:strand:+ start:3529 stop:4278 length:750 start_codon:yes stop_codon:yes gene_type:complete